jgi:hypothetical protein
MNSIDVNDGGRWNILLNTALWNLIVEMMVMALGETCWINEGTYILNLHI